MTGIRCVNAADRPSGFADGTIDTPGTVEKMKYFQRKDLKTVRLPIIVHIRADCKTVLPAFVSVGAFERSAAAAEALQNGKATRAADKTMTKMQCCNGLMGKSYYFCFFAGIPVG